MLAVATLAVLTVGLSYLSFRWRKASSVLEGVPVIIIREGTLLRRVVDIERLTEEEVAGAAREQGIDDLADVRLGVLEADGSFSFIRSFEQTPEQERIGRHRAE